MPRHDVSVITPDGECPASLHVPEGGGPAPAVIIYVDAAGLRETFKAMGDTLAGMGYVALVPDVYYRAGDWAPFDVSTAFSDPAERARLGELIGALTADMTVSDTGAFLDFLAARPEVSGDLVGTTGYCMGGRASLLVAGRHPERIGAAASFHGGNLAGTDDENSPYRLADHMRAVVYVAAAENDPLFPDDQYERLDKAFATAGTRYTMVTYPAAHGFAVPDNSAFDEAAGERHWAALADLYGATLRA